MELLEADFATSGDKQVGKQLIPGFGTFQMKVRAARTGRNPRTGDPIQIPATKVVTFKPAAALKGKLVA